MIDSTPTTPALASDRTGQQPLAEAIDDDPSEAAREHADSVAAVPRPTEGRTVVAIPAYNEARSIAAIVGQARKYADTVLVVDDGSDDATARQAADAGAWVHTHARTRGYGATLRTIFRETARRDVDRLVILAGDGQHDPNDIPTLLAGLADADVIIGTRVPGGATTLPRYRTVVRWLIQWLMNRGLGTAGDARLREPQSGFRAYSGEAVRTLATEALIDTGMAANTDVLYHLHEAGYRIAEVDTGSDAARKA